MNVINVFSFSEPYETNELLVKLYTEDPGMDEWMITENIYTYQGEYKGPHKLRSIINSDKRFEKFLHKIKIFEMDLKPTVNPPDEDMIMYTSQREIARDYILKKYDKDDTWLIVSDLDEIYDFTNPNTLDMVMEVLKKHDGPIVHPNSFCLAYDYDNVTVGDTWPRSTTIKLRHITDSNITFLDARHTEVTIGYNFYPRSTGFHYYACYEPRYILSKCKTSLHRNFKTSVFNEALYYNLGCEIEELSEINSPLYVRENIEWLRTHSVPKDYKENRKKRDAGDTYVPDMISEDFERHKETVNEEI